MESMGWNLTFLIVIWAAIVTDVQSTVRVYVGFKKTKNDAELYCEDIGGFLTSYSLSLVNSAKQCRVSDVVTNKPWIVNEGCHALKQTPNNKTFANNHLAQCVEYCAAESFVFIGVQNNRCLCYTEPGFGIVGFCADVRCPGNQQEQCGENQVIMLYKKVQAIQNNECQYVDFITNFKLLNGDCNIERYFVCTVPDGSAAVQCIDPTAPPTDASIVNESSTNLGLILGITAGVLILLIIIFVVVYFRIRKKKEQREDRIHMHPRNGVNHHMPNDDVIINAFRDPVNYHNIDPRVQDPLPLIAFGGEGIDLDKSPIPVYTAVHKKPNKDVHVDNKTATNIPVHEPAYDEVYQPSSAGNEDMIIPDNHQNVGDQRGTYSQNGSVDGSYAELRKPTKRPSGIKRNSDNEQVQNELAQNKMFRNSQTKHSYVADDDMY